MAQSLFQIYLHFVFSTKYRRSFIDESIEDELFSYLARTCNALDCPAIKVGGYRDHVHILCRLSKKITVMKLIEEVKKSSSKWMKTKGAAYKDFYWQNGYAVFSVNPNRVDRVQNYITHQKEHHRDRTFQEEVRIFFKEYQIEYDERYVWD